LSGSEFVHVMHLGDLREGRMKACRVGDREIVVCNVKGQVFALDNVCTHALARMSEGRLRGVRLICPMHGASFDVRTGAVLSAPATEPLPAHTVRIVDGAVEVALAGSK
jgi:3-phenylpropionate/trans-cinnamate dioxygenase ferredoxin subunit